jgi:ubiquinone biosynthesis monooxygenase Coq7
MKHNFYLPGDKPHTEIIDEIIRVDHSGEYGAQKIYQGQILATKHLKKICLKCNEEKYNKLLKSLQQMYDSEVPHYEFFTNLMNAQKSRPSFMLPLWSALGFIIGYISGISGENVVMTCTEGVEEVIGNHYNEQLKIIKNIIDNNQQLKNKSLLKDLYKKIEQFMHDELEHLHTSTHYNKEKMCGYFYFNVLVKSITTIAISIAKRL